MFVFFVLLYNRKLHEGGVTRIIMTMTVMMMMIIYDGDGDDDADAAGDDDDVPIMYCSRS